MQLGLEGNPAKLQRQVEGSYLLLSLGTLSLCRATETSEPKVKIEQRVSR